MGFSKINFFEQLLTDTKSDGRNYDASTRTSDVPGGYNSAFQLFTPGSGSGTVSDCKVGSGSGSVSKVSGFADT
jgi:hypothetical protein